MGTDMDIKFLTVIILALTIILMWIGYVQILNYLADKERELKDKEALAKNIWLQRGLIIQCCLFGIAIVLSLFWLWIYSCGQDSLFKWILVAFTGSQIVHLIVFFTTVPTLI